MTSVKWFISNWAFIVLIAVVMLVTLYIAIRTFVSLNDEAARRIPIEGSRDESVRERRFPPRVRHVLTFAILILGAASIFLSAAQNWTSPKPEDDERSIIKATVSSPGSYGEMQITVDRITPLENSAYSFDATVEFENGGPPMEIHGGKEGAEFNPNDKRYSITILKVDAQIVSFSVTKIEP